MSVDDEIGYRWQDFMEMRMDENPGHRSSAGSRDYSCRKVRRGLTRVARIAGTRPASAPTPRRTSP